MASKPGAGTCQLASNGNAHLLSVFKALLRTALYGTPALSSPLLSLLSSTLLLLLHLNTPILSGTSSSPSYVSSRLPPHSHIRTRAFVLSLFPARQVAAVAWARIIWGTHDHVLTHSVVSLSKFSNSQSVLRSLFPSFLPSSQCLSVKALLRLELASLHKLYVPSVHPCRG